jgi:hypothetical protein
MHMDEAVRPFNEGEEVYVLTPGGDRTALAVPLDAIPKVLELLAESLDGIPEQVCEHCGSELVVPQRTGG